MFKKSKRNLRRRNHDEDEENGGSEPMDVDEEEVEIKPGKKGKNAGSKKATLLSFADDEEDHGEVFQIKKSSYSKRLEKKLGKERRRKKEQMEVEEVAVKKEEEEMPRDDLIVVVKTDEEAKAREQKAETQLVLNGRAALMAGKNDASSSDEENPENSTRIKFSQSTRSQITIESGKIPDAATIHAARKRRERARLLNTDFIPINNKPSQEPIKQSGRRILREEEDDSGSDEERINMAGLKPDTRDLNEYFEHLDHPGDVAENQLPAVSVVSAVPAVSAPISNLTPSTVSLSKELIPPCDLLQRLRDRLMSLRQVHGEHCADVGRVASELAQHSTDLKDLEAEAPELAKRFRFYQDMRGYVTDLVECLDEKVPTLEELEKRLVRLWTDKAESLIARRRLDVRDEADEWANTYTKNSGGARWSQEEEEARARRAAEREGRRARRRRARETRSTSQHVDGMSSDEEQTELEINTFNAKLDELRVAGAELLADVEPEFGSVDGVTGRLESWREYDMTSYREAYASLCLPKVLAPLVRIHLLMWNPLQEADVNAEIEGSQWWSRMALYGGSRNETLTSLADDPDVLLIPTVIEKAVLPKVATLVAASWDPLSSSQTLRLVSLLKKHVAQLPGVSSRSPQVSQLLSAVLSRLTNALENDVFIPISFNPGERGGTISAFFQRQLASAVKLMGNMLRLEGLLDTDRLHQLALDGLLNRYLLAAMRSCPPVHSVRIASMIMATFPCWWFQTSTKIPKLEMFGKQLKLLTSQQEGIDRENQKELQDLLQMIQHCCQNPL